MKTNGDRAAAIAAHVVAIGSLLAEIEEENRGTVSRAKQRSIEEDVGLLRDALKGIRSRVASLGNWISRTS